MDATIDKLYAAYEQHEIQQKAEAIGLAIRGNVVKFWSMGISKVVRIRDVEKLRRYISDDLLIKDQMVNFGALIVCILGNFCVPLLLLVQILNNAEIGMVNEGCIESNDDGNQVES